jgi:hypothetical protein
MSEIRLLRLQAEEEVKKHRKKPAPAKVRLSLLVSMQTYRFLKQYCERRGLSTSEVIRRALDLYFDHEREKGRL